MQRYMIVLFALAVVALVLGAGQATGSAAVQGPSYAGSREGCRKCHLREFRSWERTPHADAFELLSSEEQQDPECIACHVTGWNQAGGFVSASETPDLLGVGCEACHGPGSDYKDKETMKSHEASVAAGLLVPDEATCRSCHNEQSPTFSGEFDFEARRDVGVHALRRR